MPRRPLDADTVRNFVFGVEDSLVSTVGLVSGIAVAGVSTATVILAGTILVFVEAFSMAAGSLLSDNAADEFESGSAVALGRSTGGALVMFVSYVLAGLIVLAPYVVLPPREALGASVALSVGALFLLGILGARIARTPLLRKGLTMALVGGAAIAIGVLVGELLRSLGLA